MIEKFYASPDARAKVAPIPGRATRRSALASPLGSADLAGPIGTMKPTGNISRADFRETPP